MMIMEHGACNVIYLDRRATDEHVRKDQAASSLAARASTDTQSLSYSTPVKATNPEVRENVNAILAFFNEVYVCTSGSTCLSKISELHQPDADGNPILVLIDMPFEDEERVKRQSREPRTPSPTATRKPMPSLEPSEPEDIYGMHLLLHLASEIQQKTYSRLVVPVAVLSGFDQEVPMNTLSPKSNSRSSSPPPLTDTMRLVKYLDAGAVDVYTSPLSPAHLHGLAVHAYRVFREVTKDESSFLMSKRNRKLSWVGVEEQKPYAYLREAMVSGLMSKICNPETVVETHNPSEIEVRPDRKALVEKAIGSWSFSAHDYSDDELLYASLCMLDHMLTVPELEKWRISRENLTVFLLACRSAYNEFVLYHNFRHVADVLQSLFYFLLQIGIIPPYPPSKDGLPHAAQPPPVASLLKPFDALTLLISAIGHDVGHPGVNNAFLVALNAPLAQLYNDRSVLESFHCAAYSQILRRFWPEAFADAIMRRLMITSILATDMGLHFKYMADLGNLEQKLADSERSIEGWNGKQCEEQKDLLCGLLIKCADISNVARKFDTAARWAHILTDEFSNQGAMEQELQIPTCLFGGPPVLDSVVKMAESQIGFMNIFARPLFEGMTNIFPAMQFSVKEILNNKGVWEAKMEKEKQRLERRAQARLGDAQLSPDVAPSPRSRSRESISEMANRQAENQNAQSQSQGQERRSDSFPLQDQEPPSHTDASLTGSSRPSSGSGPFQFTGPASSHRSSLGVISASEKASRQSSATGLPNSHQDILVTETPPTPRVEEKMSYAPPVRPISPTKRQNSPNGFEANGVDEPQRPTTAPSLQKARYGPDSHDMASFPMSPPRPIQSEFDPQNRHFHHVSSETDLQHLSNGVAVDGTSPNTPRTWEPERRKRSDDSGVSPQDDSPDARWNQHRIRQTNSRGSQRWKSNWKRDRAASGNINEKVPNRDEKGGYLSAVTSNSSMQGLHERSRGKFGLGKFWKKLKQNGGEKHYDSHIENEGGEVQPPREDV